MYKDFRINYICKPQSNNAMEKQKNLKDTERYNLSPPKNVMILPVMYCICIQENILFYNL